MAGILIPYWVLVGLGVLLLGGILLLGARLRRYRERTDLLEEQALMSQARVTPANWHPDHRAAQQEELQALQDKHKRLIAAYQTLHSRHTGLLDELKRRQQSILDAKGRQVNGHASSAGPTSVPSNGHTQPEDLPKL